MCPSFLISGRKPSFNLQCLRPQSSVDTLPIPDTYRGSSPSSRSRLQVNCQGYCYWVGEKFNLGIVFLIFCIAIMLDTTYMALSWINITLLVCLAHIHVGCNCFLGLWFNFYRPLTSAPLDPAQPRLEARQHVVSVHGLLGRPSGLFLHRHHPYGQGRGFHGPQGQATLHAHDAGGPDQRRQPACVDGRHRQPPCGEPTLGLVPWSIQDLHQWQDTTHPPTGPHREGQR